MMCYFLLEYVLKLAPKDYIIIQYRKIPKISPGAYIFQRPFLRGLFFLGGGRGGGLHSDGLMYEGKFAFQNR